jgi:hypothetical protein
MLDQSARLLDAYVMHKPWRARMIREADCLFCGNAKATDEML